MVFERPPKPGQSANPATSRPTSQKSASGSQKKIITTGGGGRNHGNGDRRGGNGNGDIPSPWLIKPEPTPDQSASFVEYLRWMRSPDSEYKDPTKVQILQMAEENANYQERLTELTSRTRLIAGETNTFQVKCLWRVRVGGHRGPESILLPAFDALGMPYLPSSTLRGVARTQAIRHFMDTEGLDWKAAEQKIAPFFGSLTAEGANRSGKVIFLDAYPLPAPSGKAGGLAVDMANNIWSWDAENGQPQYAPNPNPFFSLKDATFLIGICPARGCDDTTLEQVKQWLIGGLQAGIGSQVNTGYGEIVRAGQSEEKEFFQVEFTLEGQLIHGRQRFLNLNRPYKRDRDGQLKRDRNGKLQPDTISEAEVRPVAFKSMLRYWFRVFALGVLPSREVQRLEGRLFGAISPQPSRGWVTVRIADGRVDQKEARPNAQGKTDPCGEQSGRLILICSSEAPCDQRRELESLFKTLTWMMFHLGGIGQGARRPCYSRRTRERAPWWRGATLFPDTDDQFWKLPEDIQEFQSLFRQRLQTFYDALGRLADRPINARQPLRAGQVGRDRWTEAADANCRIIVCSGEEDFGKPYALAVLHSDDLKREVEDRNRGTENRQGQRRKVYDGDLCGKVDRGAVPSPVWIADLGDYQVVTVFGATQEPRRRYVNELQQHTGRGNFAQIWPLQ